MSNKLRIGDLVETLFFLFALLTMAFIGYLGGGVFGRIEAEDEYQSVAIELGYAHYDTITGEFEWNKENTEETEDE